MSYDPAVTAAIEASRARAFDAATQTTFVDDDHLRQVALIDAIRQLQKLGAPNAGAAHSVAASVGWCLVIDPVTFEPLERVEGRPGVLDVWSRDRTAVPGLPVAEGHVWACRLDDQAVERLSEWRTRVRASKDYPGLLPELLPLFAQRLVYQLPVAPPPLITARFERPDTDEGRRAMAAQLLRDRRRQTHELTSIFMWRWDPGVDLPGPDDKTLSHKGWGVLPAVPVSGARFPDGRVVDGGGRLEAPPSWLLARLRS